MTDQRVLSAAWVAFLLPATLLAGAYISQFVFGLYPCEMCHWQRWPHMAAIMLALAALALGRRGSAPARPLTLLAALAIAVSGAIGAFHAGVEYGWWEGITSCSTNLGAGSPADALDSIMNAPLVRCDVPQWTLMGISLAGFNFLLSVGGAIAILILMGRPQTLTSAP